MGGPLVDWLGFTGTTPVLQVWAAVMLAADGWVLLGPPARQSSYARLQ